MTTQWWHMQVIISIVVPLRGPILSLSAVYLVGYHLRVWSDS